MTAPTVDSQAEEMTLEDLLKDLGAVSDDHVTAGITAVLDRVKDLRSKASDGLTEDEAQEVKALKEAYGRLDSERQTRETARKEVEDDLAGFPEAEATEDKPGGGEGDKPDHGDTPAPEHPEAPETPMVPVPTGPSSDPDEETVTNPQENRATASVPRLPLGTIAKAQDRGAALAASSGAAGAAIVAAAGDAQKGVGANMSAVELYEAIDRRRKAVGRGYGGVDDKVIVASIEAPDNDGRRLSQQRTDIENTRKIDAITASGALTAAGICAPYVIDYSIDAIGTVARPIRDSFPQFVADRGGIQFRRDVDSLGNGPVSASGTWSMATDATPGGATKPLWDVSCNTVIQAEVTAITYGLRFSNVTNRFDPEAVAANTKAAAVAHARFAEMALLNSMYSQVTATFTGAAQASAGRDLLVAMDKAQAYMRNNRRQGTDITLRTMLPVWVRDLIRSDMTRAMHTANEEWLGLTNQAIEQWFSNRGIQVTWMIDGRAAVTASGTGNSAVPAMDAQIYGPLTGTSTLPAYPTNVEFPLFPEGAFVFLDGGSLDVGVVRDQNLVQTNRYIQFQESWEGLYRKGVEAVRVVQAIQPTGGSAGTITPSTLAS